ncbi:MAG: capsular polysaccharide export protein, partial [Campylobacterota bacterium]|nr:capsular polysaccharide export protein [Campylobacterota bacterium]
MLKSGLHHFKDKNVLLLQGPIGPFFYRLSKDLKAAGATVFKINFNGGDLLFYPTDAVLYTKSLVEFEEFLENFCTEHNIDTMLFFNDCRPLHRVAIHTAQKLSIKTGVFEEGYIRPNFITFENGGVNAFSPIPRDPAFYKNIDLGSDATFKNVKNPFPFMATWAILYWA